MFHTPSFACLPHITSSEICYLGSLIVHHPCHIMLTFVFTICTIPSGQTCDGLKRCLICIQYYTHMLTTSLQQNPPRTCISLLHLSSLIYQGCPSKFKAWPYGFKHQHWYSSITWTRKYYFNFCIKQYFNYGKSVPLSKSNLVLSDLNSWQKNVPEGHTLHQNRHKGENI